MVLNYVTHHTNIPVLGIFRSNILCIASAAMPMQSGLIFMAAMRGRILSHLAIVRTQTCETTHTVKSYSTCGKLIVTHLIMLALSTHKLVKEMTFWWLIGH